MIILDTGRFAALGDEEVISPSRHKRSRPDSAPSAGGGGNTVANTTKGTKKGGRVALFSNTTVVAPVTNAMSLVKLSETLHASKLTKYFLFIFYFSFL
jgi:hypothetical protein